MAKQSKSPSPYLRLEKKIAKDEGNGVIHRWQYGRGLIKERKGFAKLPKGRLNELIVEAIRSGLKLTEREIQWRIKCATVYGSEAELRTACTEFGSWSALREAGFPPVEVDESDEEVDEIDDITANEPGPGFIADPLFDIPGFKPVLRINGRKRDLADIVVRDAIAYRDMCDDMHANFGRTVAQIKASVELMVAGAAGDLDANAVEAWRRATSPPTE
jgi:hypothetical protein